MSTKNYHFEHVTPFIKENDSLFIIEKHPISIDNPFPNLRLTVDTPEDYALARTLYDRLYKGSPFSLDDTLALLKEHPHLVEINSQVRQRPMDHASDE